MSLLKVNEVQNYNGSSLTLTASTVSTSAQLNTGGNISVTGSINVSDDSTTRSNLGLGSIATQDSDNVTVTGGTATLGALTVSGSDSGDLVRITQTGSGNALVVEDDTNPDATPFVVDNSGNVLVGTTNTNAAGSNVVGISLGADGQIDASRNGASLDLNRISTDGTIVNLRKNGTVVGSISTNTSSLPSDRDFKKDINDLNLGLELVKKLKPKSYRYNIDDDNSPFMTGLIAQDLEESLAEVGVVQNESWILQYNENAEEGNSKYELDYLKLIPILTKAIQEQQSQIDALTARIEALETA